MMPTKQGQLCTIISPKADEDANNVYIVVEDPIAFDDDDDIYVVNLKDLQRNIRQPSLSTQVAVTKNELVVLADDIESYIKSWNN